MIASYQVAESMGFRATFASGRTCCGLATELPADAVQSSRGGKMKAMSGKL
jgi:hypothetical protein